MRWVPPVELLRDTATERQFGLVVRGQAVYKPPVLGLIAIRCARHGEHVVPLTLSIPETPVVDAPREVPMQSYVRRKKYWWRESDGT